MITCPKCSSEIKLTESLAAPYIQETRKIFDEKFARQEANVSKREIAIRSQQKEIALAKEAIDEKIANELKTQCIVIAEKEKRKAKYAVASELEEKSNELSELNDILVKRDKKLIEAQKAQIVVVRQQRELEDARRELDLTVEKRVQESISKVRESIKAEVDEANKLKVSEKEEQISSMQRQIEDLMRKAEQGSQQLQGEVFELALEAALGSKFPLDNIEPVAKGEFGGDVLQRVNSSTGNFCGAILWETKRTKNWSDGWLAKLRNDQRVAKADIAIIISQTMPKNIDTFGPIDGVWVTAPQYYIPLAIALRQTLIEISNTKIAGEGQQTKMELVYEYLTGPRFRHRIEAIVEKFSEMQTDLNRERKSMTRLWAKREAQIQGVIESTVGMYGDLQGIAGQAIQEIEGLDLPLLESDLFEDK